MKDSAARRRNGSDAGTIPAFFLYGEPLRAPDERTVHVETIAARSQLHNWHIRPHRHRDLHQLLITQAGQINARLDGSSALLRGPAVVIVPPGVVHSFQFEKNTVGIVVSFATALGAELAGRTAGLADLLEQPIAAVLRQPALDATDIAALAEMLLQEFQRSANGRDLALSGLLGALLANLLRVTHRPAPSVGGPTARQRELIARLRQSIELKYREHGGIAAYARELGTSEARLRKACLAVTGNSPIELVHSRLLIEAERQLRYTSMSVAQVAYYLGFEDPAYFSRFFTQRMDMSPRQFRVSRPSA